MDMKRPTDTMLSTLSRLVFCTMMFGRPPCPVSRAASRLAKVGPMLLPLRKPRGEDRSSRSGRFQEADGPTARRPSACQTRPSAPECRSLPSRPGAATATSMVRDCRAFSSFSGANLRDRIERQEIGSDTRRRSASDCLPSVTSCNRRRDVLVHHS